MFDGPVRLCVIRFRRALSLTVACLGVLVGPALPSAGARVYFALLAVFCVPVLPVSDRGGVSK